MNKKFYNIEIIMTIVKNSKSLSKVLISLSKQSYLPKKIIIVSFEKLKKPKYNKLNIKIIKSPKKNQVFQRTLGLKHLSKSCNILLQLDDRIILKNNTLKNLNNCWSVSDKNVVGIGLNPTNIEKKYSGFINYLFTKIGYSGKILKNGMNIRYSNLTEDTEVMWLMGGLSSWKLAKTLHLYKRNFPMWDWSVGEDIEFCLSIKKNHNLLVCSEAKVKILEKKINIDKITSQNRGYFHSLSAKRITNKTKSNKILFNLFALTSILLSLFFYSIALNRPKILYNIGRLKGLIINK